MRITPPRRRRSSLAVEALEGRGLLSGSTTMPWPDPAHLTLSCAPDGTSIGGAPSALYQALGARQAPAAWQATVARAFQSWAAVSNVNFGLVRDNGLPAGQPGAMQGEPGLGDIRLAARPLDPASLAITTGFDLFNTWSGTIIFNSTVSFADGSNATQDLFTAALHEAGHALGLPHSTDPASAMYGQPAPRLGGPSPADIAAVQTIYGARQPDAFEGGHGNDSLWTPTRLTYLATTADAAAPAAALEADLTTPTDRDTFLVTTPAGTTAPTFLCVRAAGLSLVTPRVTAFDLLGQPIATAATTDPLRNDVTLTVPAGLPGSSFLVRVEAAQAGVFGIGAYRIAAGAGTSAETAAAPTSGTAQGVADDGGRNNTPQRATTLKAAAPADDPRWTYTVRAGIAGPAEADYYAFKTGANTPPVLVVSVGGVQASGLMPRVDVLDKRGNPVALQLLNSDVGSYTVQVPRVDPNTTYLVRVAAANPAGPRATGRYFLGIDLRATPLPLVGFAAGALQGGSSSTVPAAQDFRTLTVAQSLLFRFDLSADGGGAAGDAAVRAIVYDAQGRPVYSLRATNTGTSAAGDVLLAPGTYTVRFVAATRSGAALPLLLYNLRGVVRSDPVGPTCIDTTLFPIGGTGDGSGDPYDWTSGDTGSYSSYFILADPLSNPWAY